LFHNANFFGSCIIHILYTECAEIKKNNSGAKGLSLSYPTGRVIHRPEKLKEDIQFALCFSFDASREV